MRFNELIAGVRSDVAVKVYGDDFDAMQRAAARHRRGAAGACPAPPTSRSSRPRAARHDHRGRPRGGRPPRPRHADGAGRHRHRHRRPRVPAWSSKATAASTSWCACRRMRATSTPLAEPAIPFPNTRASTPRADASPHAAARVLRWLGSIATDHHRRGPEPDQPRERQATRRHPGERARPRPRQFVRRRGAAAPRRRAAAGRRLARIGRHLPEPRRRPGARLPSSCRCASS